MSTRPRSSLAWVSSTYFAQGLPYSLVHQVAGQLFTAWGVSLAQVGLTSLYGLAWNLKFLWGPLVDRTQTPRRWVAGVQGLLALLTLGVAGLVLRGEVRGVAIGLGILALAAALHDVTIDGHYLGALPAQEQARHSGTRVAAYRAALLVGNGLLVWVGGTWGFGLAFALAALLLLALCLSHAFGLPADVVPRPEAQEIPRAPLLESWLGFFRQPRALGVVAFLLVFRAGDAMMFQMSSPLLRSLGMDTSTRGLLSGLGGTLASVVGSLLGGAYVARRGLGATLFPIAAVQSAAILLYVLLASIPLGPWGIASVVLLEQLVAGVGTAAFVVFLARRCSGPDRASHFALATSLMSLASTGAGAASGFLAEKLAFPGVFALAFAASLPGVALAWRLRGLDLPSASSSAPGTAAAL